MARTVHYRCCQHCNHTQRVQILHMDPCPERGCTEGKKPL